VDNVEKRCSVVDVLGHIESGGVVIEPEVRIAAIVTTSPQLICRCGP
jgi:hypothetical protein